MAKTGLDDVLSAVDKINPDAQVLSKSPLSLVDSWIDTGNYALNAIISGSCYGGIPEGRITGLTGPSGCGKTLFINKIIGNFQRPDKSKWALAFDSELAEDPQSAASVGAIPDRIKHIPVNTVNECRNQLLAFLDKIIENNLQGSFMASIIRLVIWQVRKKLQTLKLVKMQLIWEHVQRTSNQCYEQLHIEQRDPRQLYCFLIIHIVIQQLCTLH